MMKQLPATAIVARNSLAYVAHVFASGEARRTLVSIQDAHLANDLQGIAVDRCIEVEDLHGWYSNQHALVTDDLPAVVTFTSGTEGTPKAIVLSYANLADTAGRIIRAMGMTSDIREYVGVPVTYSFGMGRFRAISAVGGSAYLSPRGFDPLELVRMLESGEVNSLSAVPTLLRILLDSPEIIGAAGSKLLWMEIGSQYMSASEKRRIRELFPNARIFQHYGLTEASRSTFLDVANATDEGLESVGRPEGSVEIGFDGQGRIRIRGPHVARWRVDAQGLHALCDAEGWLQTNDLGRLRDGYLFFDGRADDLINCGGIKISPDVLEEKIRARLGSGSRIAVARVADVARGEAVLVVTEAPADLQKLGAAAAAAMGELGVAAAGSLHVRQVAAIPATATGKPRRRELSADFEAARKTAAPGAARPAAAGESRDVRGVFQRVFPGTSVAPDDTFESLGGDSLRYIQFSMQYERRFGLLPDKWESLSVAQLQARAQSGASKSFWRGLEPATLLRALAMVFIAARHTGAFEYSKEFGAGILLFALGGYALARFQLPEIIRQGSVRTILGTALLVAIPTILVVGPTQVMTHTFFEPQQFLMISNFFDPTTPARINGVPFYFAEIYFQLFLLAALVFSFPRVRALFRERPVTSALGLFVAALVFKLVVDRLWDTHYLFQRVPQNYAWSFCLGILVGVARTLPQRLLALALAVTCSYVMWGFASTSTLLYAGGLALVLFLPTIRVPALVKTVVGEIAAGSIFIYLVHFQVRDIVHKLTGGQSPWLALLAAIAVGIACAYAYGYAQRLLGQTQFGRKLFGSLATQA
jgi:acyl-CoA synthetase (AMP-forming)/AMP-acid ligase II